MITLTTDGSGVAANSTLSVETGRRYVFQWGDDIITGPTAGTLTIKIDWNDATPAIHDPSGTAVSWDMSTANSGAVEFAVAQGGVFAIAITGGGATKTIHCALRALP